MTDAELKVRTGASQGYDFKVIFDVMKAHDIDVLTVSFDGQGDSGDISDAEPDISEVRLESPVEVVRAAYAWAKDQSPEVKVMDDFEELVRYLCYELIEKKHGGWENNEGAFGTIVFDSKERTAVYEHNTNVISYDTDTYTFCPDGTMKFEEASND